MTAASLVFLILSAHSPLRAAEPTILTPTNIFPLQAPAGLNLIAMTGHQDQLYLLLSDVQRRTSAMAVTDATGNLVRHFKLPTTAHPITTFRIAPTGHIATLEPQAVNILTPSGEPLATINSPQPITDIQFIGDKLMAIDYAHAWPLGRISDNQWRPHPPDGHSPIATPLPSPFLSAPIPDGRVALVTMVDSTYQVISDTKQTISPVLLQLPDLHRTGHATPESTEALIAHAAASATHIYLYILGHPIAKGIVIDELDPQGLAGRTFRCMVPLVRRPRGPKLLLPTHMAIVGSSHYLADATVQTIARYRIPSAGSFTRTASDLPPR